jgi:hypothetical protein
MWEILSQSKHAKAAGDAKAKPAAKTLPAIPGMDSKLFKQAMAEQKSHGVEMKGPKMGR